MLLHPPKDATYSAGYFQRAWSWTQWQQHKPLHSQSIGVGQRGHRGSRGDQRHRYDLRCKIFAIFGRGIAMMRSLWRIVNSALALFLALTACSPSVPARIVDSTPQANQGTAPSPLSSPPSFRHTEPPSTPSPSSPMPVGTSIRSSSPSTPLTIHFIMAKAPKLNEPVNVTVTIKSVLDAPDTTASLELPNSAVLVSGTLSFQGNLSENEPARFEAVIKFVAEGNWAIRAVARRVVSQDEVWGDAAYIYLHVGKESSHFGFEGINFPPTPSTGAPPPPAITPSPKH